MKNNKESMNEQTTKDVSKLKSENASKKIKNKDVTKQVKAEKKEVAAIRTKSPDVQEKQASPRVDKIYTIPLRKVFRKPRNKRSKYAISLIHDYILRHVKKQAKIGQKLNEEIWKDGIKQPPRRIRVGVKLDGEFAKVELMGFEYKDFKAQKAKLSESMKDKLMNRLSPKAMANKELEDKIEGKKPKIDESGKSDNSAKEDVKGVKEKLKKKDAKFNK